MTYVRYLVRLVVSCGRAAADVLTHHLARGSDALRLSNHRRSS